MLFTVFAFLWPINLSAVFFFSRTMRALKSEKLQNKQDCTLCAIFIHGGGRCWIINWRYDDPVGENGNFCLQTFSLSPSFSLLCQN